MLVHLTKARSNQWLTGGSSGVIRECISHDAPAFVHLALNGLDRPIIKSLAIVSLATLGLGQVLAMGSLSTFAIESIGNDKATSLPLSLE